MSKQLETDLLEVLVAVLLQVPIIAALTLPHPAEDLAACKTLLAQGASAPDVRVLADMIVARMAMARKSFEQKVDEDCCVFVLNAYEIRVFPLLRRYVNLEVELYGITDYLDGRCRELDGRVGHGGPP